ncbi:putative Zn-binding protein involved in type VI secretion [Aeromonas sp. BIGb0405]|uniref:Ig-like domain-containing protein n=1 Tax=Aeromonas sp. BIGb0405 TaxID=2940592 RepID=UPI0021681657|nr:Ig-like domain-containing protein [Aeromonas sp. BIGb0405]MCS3457768.1 putative Zn-binding protein involved in type VI secretion [Aeromonas sp. BIGb0405]
MSANTITLEQDIVVTHLTQPVYLVGEDGSLRQLAEGDAVAKGAQLLSPEGGTLGAGTLQISLPVADLHPDELDPAGDGVLLALNQGEGEPSATGAVSDDIAALQAAILDGVDPTKAFEASAAGGAPAAGGGVAGGSGNGGFIVVDRSADSTLAQGGFDTDEPASAIVRREDLPAAADELLLDATAPQISVSAPDNIKDATPTLTGITDAAPGSTVTLVVTDANGNQQVLIATVNPDGSFSVDVATPLADGDYRVTASVTDPAGNTGTAADDGSVDSTAPSVTVTAPDNTNDSTPTITGTTNAAPGSTVTLVVTDANGNQQTLTATVQPDGTYSSNVVTPLPDGGYEVTASVTDPAGNTGTAADDGSVDTTANITVSLDDVNGDNVGNAPITGTSDVGPGRTVTLVITDANGDKVTVTAVIDGNGNYSTTADLSGLADGNLTVVASATDAAGNRADARDDTTSLDTTAPDARITLDADITPDDIINAAEANQNIAITGTVGGDVRVGDTVILTVNGKTFTGLVLADKTFNIKVPGADLVTDGDKLIDARVTTTDAAGNSTTATGSEGYSVDTQGPSVLVDIVDTQLTVGETSDVTFTFSEQVTGFDPSDLTVVGGTVTGLTTSDGGKTWSGTFTPDANFEGTASVTVKPESYTDLAGNQGSGGSDSAAIDTQATGAPTVVITEDIDNDGTIDRTEISGKVDVNVGLPTDAKAGDTLKVSGQADRVLTDTDISAGKVGYEFDRPTDGVTLTVTATLVDGAGNVSAEGKDSAVMGDTTATGAPTVVITEDANNDGTISNSEISGPVNVEVGLPAEAKAGDTLKVSGQADRVLSDADVTAGKVGYEFDRPADGVKLTVTATIVDAAGNVSAEGSDSATMGDTTGTGAPTVVITEDTDNDGTIDRTEISGKVDVNVGLPTDAKAGDTLKVSGQADRVLSDADITAGKVAYEFDRPADGQKITVTATLVDGAGNESLPGSDSATMGDTTATGAPTVVITEDTDNDGTIDRTEISGKVDVNVGLPAEAKAGDTLKVSGQADRVLSDADISAGKVGYEFDRPADGQKITVTATLVDGAGNESLPGSDSATMGDTTATGAPTVGITEDANNDGTIDRTEISGKVDVNVGLPAEAKAGDTLKVSGQADRVLSDADITAGKVAYEFDRPADGVTLTVTATLVDGAGNVSAEGKDSAVMGDTTATGAPTVTITEDANNDGTIDRTEISGKVDVNVGLPTDAKAGDTLKVSGQADRVLSDADITAGKVAYEFDRPADGVTLTVTATLVDGAGNVSAEGKDSAVMGDTTATGAPTVVITEDANNDGTISNSEISGPVNVEVGLPAEAKAGDTLKVSGQADRVLSDADITAGKVAYEFDRPADGVKLTVTATLVDGAGNVSAEGSDSAVMGDTTATGAPTVVITEDTDNDGTISNSEINGAINVEVGLPAEAKAGDTLKVSGQADRVLTDTDITAGKVAYEFDRPADGVTLTVTATLVDGAGNVSLPGSDRATMGDTTATGAPTVVITEDANNDGTISNSEISGPVNVEVGLPAEAKAGDTLKVSGQADRVLTDADITAGKVAYEFDRPADGVTLTVTASIVDGAGNESLPGSDSATMGDTTATGAPTVVITEDANNDGTISNSEINGAINVEVGLPAEAKAGDTLKVSGQADRVLSDADISAGKVAYEFDRPADGQKITVTATIVDGAGNVSAEGKDSATMGDTTATGAPTVVITEDTNNDGTIDRTEISGKVDVNVGLPTDAKAGDTLKVSGQADRVLTDADITAGKVAYEFDRPADGVKLTVTASIVDAAGNVSAEGSDSAVMGDTTATGAPTVVITEDANNDGTISNSEINGAINVEVSLPAEAKAGDTLKVSGQADRVLSDTDISAGKVGYEFDRPADGQKITVTASIVDGAGNVSAEGKDSAVMGDTTATGAPTVVITEDTDNDGTIDRTEISGKVDVNVGLPAEAKAGDTLKVSGQADRVLSDADISAGKVGYEFDRPADGVKLTVTATLVDAAGNVSAEGSDSAVMGDTTATGAPTVVITEDANNDGTIDRTEINGKVNVEVGLPTDAKAGDTLKVSGQADRVLSDADISAGKVGYEFDRPADGVKLTVTATIVDGAGNESLPGSDSATMGDTTATGAPSVVITEDANNDGTISNSEINGKVDVNVSLPTDAKAGDTLKVSGQVDRVLSDADITAGKVAYEFDRPADGVKLTVTATIVDAAGNVSAEGRDSATMGDTTATGAPTVVITEDANNDGTISNSEINGAVNVEVSLPAEAKAGDTLKVSGQADRVLSDADITAGKVAYEFDRPADGVTLTVTATIVDAAGNVSAEGKDSATMGDTTATGAPTVVITEDADNDGTIDRTEINGKVNVEVGLPTDAKAGDTLKVSGQADRVLSDADISAGKVAYEFDRPADGQKITVTATIVDGAGNVSAEGSDSAVMGDTTATGAPTVVITEDANNDGIISNSEISGKVDVNVGLPAEAKAGDTLKVSGQADRVLSDADISAGKVAYEFDRPADGVKLTVTATIVDGAGNESLPGSDSATMGDTTATGAPTVVITEDANNDGTISNSEINGAINVEVGLPAEAKAGDTLKVSGQADRVLSDADITAGKVAYEFDRPADGVKLTVTATLVDGAGNVSAEGKDSAVMGDTTATGAPTVVITEDANNDGTISNSEINGAINVEVGLPAEAKAGDTLKVSGQADRVLSDADITAGKVAYEFDRPADGVTLTVTATIVDGAGNESLPGSDSATMGDTTATGAPTVVITEDIDNDGTIDRTEISGKVDVNVGLPTDAKAGDTLKVSGQADRVLSDADISAGKVGYEFDRPADGVKLTVTATLVDAAGNVSAEGSDSATMGDTTATGAPTVVITEDTNNDGTISNTEISGKVNVEVGLPADAKAGDTLKVSGQADRVLTDADISAGKVGYEFDRPADGVKLTVTATIVDAAGNVSAEGKDSAVMGDTTATGAPTVVITEDTNNDGTISNSEINGAINVEVGLPAEAKAGDTLKVSGQADRVLSDADITAGKVGYEFDRPADGAGLTVTATIVDGAGNESLPGSDSATMGDTTATGAPTVTITEDANNDGTISNSEINGAINVEVSLPAEAKAGDTLKVSGQADRVLSDADITAGKVAYEFDRPADGVKLTVTATLVDGAGNESLPGSDSATMGDTTATGAPTVVITEDTNNDGTIDRTEISGKVDVNVGLPTDAKAGDTLKVSGQVDRVLSDADITAGKVAYEFDRPADGVKLTVTATIVDGAGNESLPGSDSATMGDTTATGAPTVVITEDANNDGTIDRTEINGKVNVEVGLPAEAKAGDTLKVSGQADRVLTDADITAGKVAYEFDRPADGQKITVTATIVDAAGNVSAEGKDSATMGDTTATGAPTVVITEDANNDGTISNSEISGPVNVEVGLPAEAKAGDTLKVSGQADRVLSDTDITAGKVAYEFDRPADGVKLTVTATIVDGAGNESLPGSDSATMGDTTATGAPTVVIVDDVNNDQMLTKAEIGNDQIQVRAGVSHADLVAGGKVTLTINNGAVSSTVELTLKADGTLQSNNGKSYGYQNGVISWTEATPGNGTSLTVTATQTDQAGNTSLPGSDTALVLAVPVTSGGYASGAEDTPLSLKWSDFKASDADTPDAQLSIRVTSLPADGLLQYKDAEGKWQTVTQALVNSGLTFSKGDIDAGKLQFLPDLHESSSAAGNNGGTPGNKLGDYAAFDYLVSDGVNASDNAKFVIDIKPVVDGVTLKVELVSGGLTQGAAKVEEILDSLQGKNPSSNPTGGNDYLVSSNGSWVDGGAGNDTIKFGSGTSFQAIGGAGNDTLIGGASVNEVLIGGDGDDILIGGKNATSSVKLQGDGGNDTLISQSLKATTSYYGGDGQDVAYMPGSMKALKLVTTGLPNSCDYRLVYTDPVTGAVTNHDFYSVETLYLQDGKYQFEGGQLSKVADLATLKIDADLIDTDGSERFTELTIKGLPQGAEVSGGTLQADGSWKVPASMLDQDGKLSLQIELPVGSQNIKVTVVAGSQEYDMNGQPISGEVKFTEADAGFMIKPANPNGDNTLDGGGGDDVLLGDIGGIKTSVEPGKNYNVALIVDTSGSMAYGLDGNKEPSRGQDRMTLTINALKVLANQLASHDGVVNVTLIGFAGSASNMLKIEDLNSANLQTLINKITALSADGGTNYEDAFIKATEWFNTKPGSGTDLKFENLTYFLTDGDPTTYNGDKSSSGGTTNDADMQKAIDVFTSLSGLSEVKAIGIGTGVTEGNLKYFDNTQVTGASSQYGQSQILNDFSSNSGVWRASSWGKAGDSSGTVVRDNDKIELTDKASSGASIFTSATLAVAAGNGIRFDLSTDSDFSSGDSFSVQLQRWNGSSWVNVGSALNTTGMIDSGPLVAADYRYVFTLNDIDDGWSWSRGWDNTSATLVIDNLAKVTDYPPIGQPDIITKAEDLQAVLVGGSVTNTPAEVGSDTVKGGAGSDILFGDAINTDYLPWGAAGNPAKPTDWVNGKGLDGLTQFLTLKNGYAPSTVELYEYIKGNAKSFDVAGDTRGGHDKLYGGLGDDILFGQGGNDELSGDAGNDALYGGTGNDTLSGGLGNDILTGGLGNDILKGDAGSDAFTWLKGDTVAGSVAKDYVLDFSKSEGDKLDLSDLLDSDGSKNQSSLKSLLSVFQDSEGVHLQVKESSAAPVTQEIVLMNHSFDTLTGNAGATSTQVIDFMLNNHMLEIDK